MSDVWLVGTDGRRVPDRLATPIGSTGSQGAVWTLRDHPGSVAKIVHRTDPVHLAARIRAMLSDAGDWTTRDGHPVVAWPTATVRRRHDDRLLGYAAPLLAPPAFGHLPELFNTAVRTRVLAGATWAWWLTAAETLARAVHAVHLRGHVVGDVAPANLFAAASGAVTLIDVDGWQLHDTATGADLLCPFSRPDYTAPEELDRRPRRRSPDSDAWALAVVVVQLLHLGFHPFGGVPADDDAVIEEAGNVRARRCWLLGAPLRTPPAAAPGWLLPELLRRRLREAVETGYDDPAARPRPLDWAAALARTRRTLRQCPDRPTHVHAAELTHCPWCAMVARGARDPFPPAGSHHELRRTPWTP